MLGNVTHYEHLSNMILHKKQIAEKYFDKKINEKCDKSLWKNY